MRYNELYEKAQNEGQTKDLSAEYKEWKNAGDFIVGKFLGCNTVTSRLGSGEYNQYLFETDDGLIKFAMGAVTDSEVAPLMEKGNIYRVEYQGKTKISGGRQVNRFKVGQIQLSHDMEIDESREEAPF